MAGRARPVLTDDEKARKRFWEKVDFEGPLDGCWLWQASTGTHGYGWFGLGDQVILAHRFAWADAWRREIPQGLDVDHLCSVKECVNPLHLEPVPPAENMRRAGKRKKFCVAGHPRTPENLYTNPTTGGTQCRVCRKRQRRESYERNREKEIEYAKAWNRAHRRERFR